MIEIAQQNVTRHWIAFPQQFTEFICHKDLIASVPFIHLPVLNGNFFILKSKKVLSCEYNNCTLNDSLKFI